MEDSTPAEPSLTYSLYILQVSVATPVRMSLFKVSIVMSLMPASSCDDFSSPVPSPLVMVSASQSGSLSAGTPLTLTCTTTLSQYVNDGEEVNTVWTGPAMTELSSWPRINITNAVDSTPAYVSELTISPLDAAMDNGTHSCTVTVTPRSGRESFVSASTILSQEQTVEVMGKNNLSQSL